MLSGFLIYMLNKVNCCGRNSDGLNKTYAETQSPYTSFEGKTNMQTVTSFDRQACLDGQACLNCQACLGSQAYPTIAKPNVSTEFFKAVDIGCNATKVTTATDAGCGTAADGLSHFRKWWELTEAAVMVNGNLITGTPIFLEHNAIRVVNQDYSYFIPLERVDYIRTDDGLETSFKDEKNKMT